MIQRPSFREAQVRTAGNDAPETRLHPAEDDPHDICGPASTCFMFIVVLLLAVACGVKPTLHVARH